MLRAYAASRIRRRAVGVCFLPVCVRRIFSRRAASASGVAACPLLFAILTTTSLPLRCSRLDLMAGVLEQTWSGASVEHGYGEDRDRRAAHERGALHHQHAEGP